MYTLITSTLDLHWPNEFSNSLFLLKSKAFATQGSALFRKFRGGGADEIIKSKNVKILLLGV